MRLAKTVQWPRGPFAQTWLACPSCDTYVKSPMKEVIEGVATEEDWKFPAYPTGSQFNDVDHLTGWNSLGPKAPPLQRADEWQDRTAKGTEMAERESESGE